MPSAGNMHKPSGQHRRTILALMGVAVFFIARGPLRASEQPGESEDLQFRFQTVFGDIYARDETGVPLYGYSLEPHGLARVDRYGRLLVQKGFFTASDLGNPKSASTDAFSLEAWIRPAQASLESEGTVLCLSDGSRKVIFFLRQEKNEWFFHLRTSGNGQGLQLHKARLFSSSQPSPFHLAVTYEAGTLRCFRNGEPVGEAFPISGNLPLWKKGNLFLGNHCSENSDWPGILEGISLYSRKLEEGEIGDHYRTYHGIVTARKPPTVLHIRGKLIAKSPVPTREELAPYTQSLSVYEYEVVDIQEGVYEPSRIYVAHWCVLDNTRLPFKDASPGQVYDLILEPFDENPQLESENLSDTVIEDFSLPLYYDAGGTSLGFESNRLSGRDERRNIRPTSFPADAGPSSPLSEIPGEARTSKTKTGSKETPTVSETVRKIGGWNQWQESLRAFQSELRQILQAEENGKVWIVEGKEEFLFQSSVLRHLLLPFVPCPATPSCRFPYQSALSSVVRLGEQLREKNIDLLFVPIPQKAEVYPENLPVSTQPDVPINPQRYRFLEELLRKGNVETVDLLPAFQKLKNSKEAPYGVYFRTDIHWTDVAVRTTAEILAHRLLRYGFVESTSNDKEKRFLRSRPVRFEITSPLVKYFAKREEWNRFSKVVDEVYTVTDRLSGTPFVYNAYRESPVVLVGDSFMKRNPPGTSLAAHLAYELQVPVTGIYERGGFRNGARILARQGSAFLKDRAVVVWFGLCSNLSGEWPCPELP